MPDGDPQAHNELRAGYVGAVDHYTSPQRRDPVKRLWEEPELVRVLNDALSLTPTSGTRVVDVGCGTGVALELLRQTAAYQTKPDRTIAYVGVDLDVALLDVAEHTIAAKRPGETVTFVRRDIRDGVPDGPVDMVISTGVPFSHLTRDELQQTLASLFRVARDAARPLVTVIDVLGRYSLEWTRMWTQQRWSYRMSFFATDQDADATDMTTYDSDDLQNVIASAAHDANVTVRHTAMTDRSIMIGRHTMTGEYTPNLPNWRRLVNALYDSATQLDLTPLRCELEIPPAPAPVARFFTDFLPRWNAAITAAQQAVANANDPEVWRHVQPQLFNELRELEQRIQPGLGVGHSLTAVVVVDPR